MALTRRWFIPAIVLMTILTAVGAGQSATEAGNSIPAGAKITTRNWRQYRQFMPDGMQALFAGKYFWKMPANVEIDVGPTITHRLPTGYLQATAKYSKQVKLAALPDGGFTIKNYVAGAPFPNPAPPHQGWKILADVWYRYIPHLLADTPADPASLCIQDRFGNLSCVKLVFVYTELRHNTDPGVPRVTPGAGPRDYAEWTMVVQPEQMKYHASLSIFYNDLTRPEDDYSFVPELRRTLRGSTASRCAPTIGSDFVADDMRFGFNGNITRFQAKVLGDKKILAMTDFNLESGKFPEAYYMPLGWAMPSWGKWELRDVWVLDVQRVPSLAGDYCYGKRIMYVDKETYQPLWEDLYDSNRKLWKTELLAMRARMVPEVGVENMTGSEVGFMWDLNNKHASYIIDPPASGRDVLLDGQAPKQYNDVEKYCGPSGLSEIMR
ncbi:MAG: DUF1329 domain-containing protein [Candidatus Binataceae bacterium]